MLHCSLDVAVQGDIIWEGYMGANKAAYLFGKVLNTEPAAEPRKQQLSTGMFLLQDVRCRSCSTPFGWSYIKAWSQASICSAFIALKPFSKHQISCLVNA